MSHFRMLSLTAASLTLLMFSTFSSAQSFAPVGNLDCNGYSKIQKPLRAHQTCADFRAAYGARGYDNGHYIGHDEPAVGFFSNAPRSGNNVQWEFILTRDRPLPAVQSYENFITVWFSMALCESNSGFVAGPCIPNSDKNNPFTTGSSFLELQFYPPGFPPFITSVSCDQTRWCAALNIDSLKNMSNGNLNPNCTEPVNFAFIQVDGIPAGPPGPATATNATFTSNDRTLLMNQGDRIRLTIKDTSAGLLTLVEDLTSGASGFMVAGAANGFESLDPNTCAPTNFNFHPEYDTAKFGNFIPWAVNEANINFSMEIGHFEIFSNDSDDTYCLPGPIGTDCLSADLDFDGPSYQRDWPGGQAKTGTPFAIQSSNGGGIGPLSPRRGSDEYDQPYPIMQIETSIGDSESTCKSNGVGCVVPPVGARFYPYYSALTDGDELGASNGSNCTLVFGEFSGNGIVDFGRDTQYGTSDLFWFFGQNTSGPRANPCIPKPN